jgi:hypothetical protein
LTNNINLSRLRWTSTLAGTLGVEDETADAVAVLIGVGVREGRTVLMTLPLTGVSGVAAVVDAAIWVEVAVTDRDTAGVTRGCVGCSVTAGAVFGEEHPCTKSKVVQISATRNS